MSTTSPDRVADGIERLPLRTPTLPPATHTNTYLVGTDEAILVEPASPYPEEVVRAVHWVKKSGRRLLAIVATHHHIDHVGGAKALAEALEVPLWAHPETAARVPELYFDRHLAADEVLELSGPTPMALRVVFTPGHAPGHICLHAEASGALIAGDMVASVGTILVEPVDGDMTLYLESLRRLIALSPSRILPAHGDPIDETEALLQHYIDHRLWREEKIRKVVIANPGAALDAIVRGAYDDVPPAVLPLARASTEAHLIKLERDGRVTRQRGADGPRWEPSAVEAEGRDPKKEPSAVEAEGHDPNREPSAVVAEGRDPNREPSAVEAEGHDPKKEPSAVEAEGRDPEEEPVR